MHRTHQRRQQRVAYAASVRLHRPDHSRPFDGRTINLSRSGVLIESLQACEVGTDVVCEIPLPGGHRRLTGRVTRTHKLSPAAVALGIEFTALASPDDDLLSRLIGVNEETGGSRLVQVQFEGMKEPLQKRVFLNSNGIRLTTSLPFLRVRSPVDVTFLSGRTRLKTRGAVREVQFQHLDADGIPRLAVDVSLTGERNDEAAAAPAPTDNLEEFPLSPGTVFRTGTRRRMVAVPARVRTPAADDGATIPDGVDSPAADEPTDRTPVAAASSRASGPRRKKRALGAVAAIFLGAGLGVGAGGGLALLHRTLRPAPSSSLAEHPGAALLNRGPRVTEAPTPSGLARTGPPASEAAPPPAASLPAPAIAAPRPALVIPPPLPDGTPGPAVDTSGAETTALVPVSGSTDGMTHHSLMRPRGLAVNLPRARTVLPVGLHRIERDGLRFVWIRDRPAGGLQIRFIFTNPPPDERLLELEEDAVRIRVRRHEALATSTPAPELDDAREPGIVAPAPEPAAEDQIAGGPTLP
jgi:PilZ domain